MKGKNNEKNSTVGFSARGLHRVSVVRLSRGRLFRKYSEGGGRAATRREREKERESVWKEHVASVVVSFMHVSAHAPRNSHDGRGGEEKYTGSISPRFSKFTSRLLDASRLVRLFGYRSNQPLFEIVYNGCEQSIMTLSTVFEKLPFFSLRDLCFMTNCCNYIFPE